MSRATDALEQELLAHLTGLVLQIGERLPGERELAEALGVGRAVLRPALDALALAGIVERRPQSGTFLTAIPAPYAKNATIAVIAPFAGSGAKRAWETEPFWLHRVISAIERVVASAGARLRLIDQSACAGDSCSVKTLARQAISDGAQAVVLIHPLGTRSTIAHALAIIHDAGVHPVIVSARTYPVMATQVYFDCNWGAYRATRYLLDRGHRRIGFASAAMGHEWVRERRDGWLSALEAADVESANAWIHFPDNGMPSERLASPEDGAAALDAWLGTPANERPTAIVAGNDVIALGLMREAERHGVAIPADLSLIGFDNDPGAMLAGLTTVERPTEALGEAAARTTLEQIAAGPETSSVTLRLRPVIIERTTVAARDIPSTRTVRFHGVETCLEGVAKTRPIVHQIYGLV